jgi:serine O-acetyltransferase
MISSKEEYRFYLEADRVALGQHRRRPRPIDDTWRYQRLLRKVEYYMNCKRSALSRAYFYFVYIRFHWMARKTGFTIHPNTIGPGLCLAHRGDIVISVNARIGENCRIHAGAGIGTEVRYQDKAATIGNNVYIGPGAKIVGAVVLGDDVAVGANAVVVRSFEAPHQTVAGIPARKVSDKGTEGLLVRATELVRAAQAKAPQPAGAPAESRERRDTKVNTLPFVSRVSRRLGPRRRTEKSGPE